MSARTMALAALALVLVAATHPASGTPSFGQNDANTGGDGGNTPDHAAPLHNGTGNGTNGGSEGVYLGEMFRVEDEADWFSTVMAVPGNLTVMFDVNNANTVPCQYTTGVDTMLTVELRDHAPDLKLVAGPVSVPICGGTGQVSVNVPPDDVGRYRVGFYLSHPPSPVTDATGVAPVTSSILHVTYAFSVTCGGVCFQGGVHAWP